MFGQQTAQVAAMLDEHRAVMVAKYGKVSGLIGREASEETWAYREQLNAQYGLNTVSRATEFNIREMQRGGPTPGSRAARRAALRHMAAVGRYLESVIGNRPPESWSAQEHEFADKALKNSFDYLKEEFGEDDIRWAAAEMKR